MRKLFALLTACWLFAGCVAAQSKDALPLAQNGKTPYVIALASDAIPAEKTAAEQLQKYLQQVTGATFSIQSETQVKADAKQILVGPGTRAKNLLAAGAGSTPTVGSDGIIIRTMGDKLILAGDRPRGTLYAVFQFLEDEVGCHWWTPTEITIPQKNVLLVQPQNVVYTPTFSYREHYTTAVQADPEFATIMRENGHHQKQTKAWGGHYNILGFVHTFSKLLPPEKYFKEHPHWYSDPTNGDKPCTAESPMPAHQRTQLNFSAPGVVDELAKQALIWIDKNPDAGYISISQNDGARYCRDEASVALAEKEGSYAAPVLKFVNQVAEKIHAKYPDFKVETLAYVFTEKPPKTIRPAKNVIIRLAPIYADFAHPFDSDENAEARANVLGWAKIAPELFVWNYVTNFRNTVFPHPNWAGLGTDLRFFADNNVKGIFEQGDNYTNGVGDFVQLRTWLLARLMWNPQLSQEKLTAEFLQGYYGAAAPHLKQYLDLIEKSFLAQNKKLSTYNFDYSFLDLETTNQAIRLFDKAEDAVKNDEVLSKRVHRERLSLDIATLFRYPLLKQAAARENKEFLGPQDPNAAMLDYIKSAQAFGIRRWAEHEAFESQVPRLEEMFAPPAPLPDFAKGYSDGDVIDIQEQNFTLYKPGTGSDIIKDIAASNGKAGSIPGDVYEWAIQAKLGNFLDDSTGQWHVYAMARVDAKAGAEPEGNAFQSGIYDAATKKAVGSVTIPLQDVAGSDYRKIDLGAHPLNSGMYFWFMPAKNPAVAKVYVDRIILIREK